MLSAVFRVFSGPLAGVAMCAVAAWLLWDNGSMWIAAAVTVGAIELWSQRVMQNQRNKGVKERLRFYKENPEYEQRVTRYINENPHISEEAYIRQIGVDDVSNWITVVNMATTAAAAVLLIVGLII